jgi:hypothetical protein
VCEFRRLNNFESSANITRLNLKAFDYRLSKLKIAQKPIQSTITPQGI